MTDHRRLQRTLFRMQADPNFARAVLAREEAALVSTGLSKTDLELLGRVNPSALAADPDNRRRMQILGNTASEFLLSLVVAHVKRDLGDFLDAFLAAPEFHQTMGSGGRLPLAFAKYGLRRAREVDARDLEAVLRLEEAMAHLRRRTLSASKPSTAESKTAPDHLQLAPGADLLELPSGASAWSEELHAHLSDQGNGLASAPCPTFLVGNSTETILLWADSTPSRYRLPDVHAERLAPPTDRLFRLARSPLSRSDRARFAREAGAEPEELERFMLSFVAEGAVQRGEGLPVSRPPG